MMGMENVITPLEKNLAISRQIIYAFRYMLFDQAIPLLGISSNDTLAKTWIRSMHKAVYFNLINNSKRLNNPNTYQQQNS